MAETARNIIAEHLKGACEEFGHKSPSEFEWADAILAQIDEAGLIIVKKDDEAIQKRAWAITQEKTGEDIMGIVAGLFKHAGDWPDAKPRLSWGDAADKIREHCIEFHRAMIASASTGEG